jgi:hypothetical protein
MVAKGVLLGVALSVAAAGCTTARPPSPVAVPDSHELREGDVIASNPKAEAFKPFVRGVAMRVFQTYLVLLKHDLFTPGVLHTDSTDVETAEAEGVMSASGEMVVCKITTHSSTQTVASASLLQQACSDVLSDPSPPPGARDADGNIHFVFRSTLKTQPTSSGPAYWVQLEAGLL